MTTTSIDREVLAVLTVLAPLGNDPRLALRWSPERREFDAVELLDDGTWSSGERRLIEWAAALWTGNARSLDLAYIATMSDRFRDACLGGLAAYSGRALPAFNADGVRA